MDDCNHLIGEYAISCGDFSVRAETSAPNMDVDQPSMARVDLAACGPANNGAVCLNANGNVSARVDGCSVNIVSQGIVVDGGNTGNVGMRTGAAPMTQSIVAGGNGKSIVLQNGQVPSVSPIIEIGIDSIELAVGPNKIKIGPTGIEITGLQVDVAGIATANLKAPLVNVEADAQVAVKGNAMASLEASGMTTVKGGMVMIN